MVRYCTVPLILFTVCCSINGRHANLRKCKKANISRSKISGLIFCGFTLQWLPDYVSKYALTKNRLKQILSAGEITVGCIVSVSTLHLLALSLSLFSLVCARPHVSAHYIYH